MPRRYLQRRHSSIHTGSSTTLTPQGDTEVVRQESREVVSSSAEIQSEPDKQHSSSQLGHHISRVSILPPTPPDAPPPPVQKKIAGEQQPSLFAPDLHLPVQRHMGADTLIPDIRAKMEAAFAADFSDVRIHTGPEASALGALAYTQGSDVHFAPGRYDPTSRQGERLLAHELTHVLQQRAGRVTGVQGKGDLVNTDPHFEAEAERLGNRAAHGMRAHVTGAPAKATGRPSGSVRQGYLIFNPQHAPGGNANTYLSNSTFEAQQKKANTFLKNGAPRIKGNANAAVRVSQNGLLAIEDAQLNRRQPKHFFADQAAITDWNNRLIMQGSFFQLVADPTVTIHFTLPGHGARNLVKVSARNVRENNSGNLMTIAQWCDSAVKEVIGGISPTRSVNPAVNFAKIPATDPAMHNTFLADYIADYVADQAYGGVNPPGVPVTGMPATGMPKVPTQVRTIMQNVAHRYGAAVHQHQVVPIPALDAALQHLGVNEYASPAVGQGILTQTTGERDTDAAGNVTQEDYYNNRTINNAGQTTMWTEHWAGVVAKDGTDFITLENYARGTEGGGGNTGSDHRFYFQMYGAGAQSWHAMWAAIGATDAAGNLGREFANPVTMVVSSTPDNNALTLDDRARDYFGNQVNAIKDDYGEVTAATTPETLAPALLKALAYANSHVNASRWHPSERYARRSRLQSWRQAVAAAAAFPETDPLKAHVTARLNKVTKNWMFYQ